jgi:Tol biopolymer transport system component
VRDLRAPAAAQVSISTEGKPGNSHSATHDLSGDGNKVVFGSSADNLVLNDTNSETDIFVRNLSRGTTRLISRSSTGEQGDGDNWSGAISGTGYKVAWVSDSTNLTEGSDYSGDPELYVKNLRTGATTLESVSPTGVPGNGWIYDVAFSPDGRYLAFVSRADNLVPSDTNEAPDVFLRDLRDERTWRVSVSSREAQSNGFSGNQSDNWSVGDYIDVSDGGKYVAFYSEGSNLVPGDKNGVGDVFVRDRKTGSTRLVSRHSDGSLLDAPSSMLSISGDGARVSFATKAQADPVDQNDHTDVYVRLTR